MIKLVDLTYHAHKNYTMAYQVVDNHSAALGFAPYLSGKIDFAFVKHAAFEGHEKIDNVPYYFFRGNNRFWSVSLKTHRLLRKLKPDVILLQGLNFPLQMIFLRLFCGWKFKLILQHHGELPASGLKGWLQKIGCQCADAFIFTSAGNADIWKKKGILKPNATIFEVLEASTHIKQLNKQSSKEYTGMTGKTNLLWVGRLNANKDPLTVLSGFAEHLLINPDAKLYMIYQTDDMLNDIHQILEANVHLTKSVTLVGKIDHEELAYWYSAADIYISGSHKEGSGYALLEAMACGCVPVVTSIPPYQKITQDGKFGFLYPAGNSTELTKTLNGLVNFDLERLSANTVKHFDQNLSFKNIAEDLADICTELMSK